jgi:adenylosuccinate lyase
VRELVRGARPRPPPLAAAREEIAYGKLSGAVGTFANNDPEVEAAVCKRLGLRPEPIATQVVPRDRHATFFAALAVLAGTCERIAVEIRHLQRTEVGEVAEPFSAGQKGSSAMPHKRNPILAENVTGLARLVRGYALAALEDMALWHERDISHSSVERVIGPDATIAMDFMLARLTGVIGRPRGATRGDAAEPRAARRRDLLGAGAPGARPARRRTRRGVSLGAASRARDGDFAERLARDPDVGRHLAPDEVRRLFDMEHHLRHIDALFTRALSDPAPGGIDGSH